MSISVNVKEESLIPPKPFPKIVVDTVNKYTILCLDETEGIIISQKDFGDKVDISEDQQELSDFIGTIEITQD